jgi:NAD(P)-dependent dehydrogenase (short-subunit alcohol dehydrogenase family)
VDTETAVALVSGGTRGIGKGIATSLVAAGFHVVITGVRAPEDAQQALDELRSGVKTPRQRVEYVRANVADPAARQYLLNKIRKSFARLDILVNNAGIAPRVRADILEASEESFDELIATNLKGPYFLTQAAANWMIQQQTEKSAPRYIVNISSVSATVASVNRGDYCIAKAGIAMATKLWASRLTEYGISVYEVRPGVIATDMAKGVKEKYDALLAGDLFLDKRWGTPEDVGKAVTTLVTGNLPYSPGAVLNIDGGMTIQRL